MATYSPDNPGIDPYVGNNMAGYQMVGIGANRMVTDATIGASIAYGIPMAAIAGGEIATSTAATISPPARAYPTVIINRYLPSR